MGKGGGSSDEQTIITELPEYAQPYFLRMMDRAEAESRVPYLRYPGERLAAITPTTGTGIDMIRGMAGLEAVGRSEDPYVPIDYVDIPEEFLAPPSPDPEPRSSAPERAETNEERLARKIRERGGRGGGDSGSGGSGGGAGYRDGGIIDLVKEGNRYRDPYGSRRYFQEGGEVDLEAARAAMHEANARRDHYAAAGEAARSVPTGKRSTQDWAALDRFIAMFGTPSVAWERVEKQLQRRGGAERAAGELGPGFQEGGEVVTPNLPAEVDLASQAAQGAVYDPNQISATYAPQLAEERRFDQAAAQQYMDPYIENVLDRLQARTQERFARQQRDIQGQAVAAGAYGGSRAALAGEQAREDLYQQLADTEAQQLSQAFQQAGQLFGADEARRLQGLTTAGQQDLTAQQATEQARYGAAQQELGRAGQLAGIGQLRQGLGLQQADALIRAGQIEQQQNQAAADLAYEEFMRERGYNQEQISFLSNILRGVPVQPNQQVTTTPYGGSGLAQGLGLGIAGLGALEAAGIFG